MSSSKTADEQTSKIVPNEGRGVPVSVGGVETTQQTNVTSLPQYVFFESSFMTLGEKNRMIFLRKLDEELYETYLVLEEKRLQLRALELAQERDNTLLANAAAEQRAEQRFLTLMQEAKERDAALLKKQALLRERLVFRNNLNTINDLLVSEEKSIRDETNRLQQEKTCLLRLVERMHQDTFTVLTNAQTPPSERILVSQRLLINLEACNQVFIKLDMTNREALISDRSSSYSKDLVNFKQLASTYEGVWQNPAYVPKNPKL